VKAEQVGTADDWFVSNLPGVDGKAPVAPVALAAPAKEPQR